ncbi:MAG: Phosphate-selective porin, partial [Akkermansiaceae bacterium]|nr:Phosphate-selective porin [Akkermansiaceae bacterium]
AVTVYGKINNFGYLVSAISNDVDREFGEFKGGASYLGEVSYDFKDCLGADKAVWVLDYMHVESNSRSDVFTTVANAAATYVDFKKGPYGVVGQVGYADGSDTHGDFYQVMVMPTYDITKKLQAVFRYQYGHGDESNSIATINRQDSTVGKFTGDEYNAAYLGLNYFIYGNKARLMAGTEYFDLSGGTGAKADNSGWTTMVGFRIFW